MNIIKIDRFLLFYRRILKKSDQKVGILFAGNHILHNSQP